MNRSSLSSIAVFVIAAASPPAYAASEIDSCPAERYKPCSFFTASVTLGEHEQIIDNYVAGFTRSKGSWTINVRYQPETQCAKVKFLVDMGPVNALGEYKEDLRNGVGQIRDTGTFMHKIGNLESALRILSSSCRTPHQVTKQSREKELGLTRANRRTIQVGLASLGFDPGPADGLFGRRTRAAISAWQAANGVAATGWLTKTEAKALQDMQERRTGTRDLLRSMASDHGQTQRMFEQDEGAVRQQSHQRIQQLGQAAVLQGELNLIQSLNQLTAKGKPSVQPHSVRAGGDRRCQEIGDRAATEWEANTNEPKGLCEIGHYQLRMLEYFKNRLSNHGCYGGEYDLTIAETRNWITQVCSN